MPRSPSADRPTRRQLLTNASAGFCLAGRSAVAQSQNGSAVPGHQRELSVNAGQLVLVFRAGQTGLTLARIGNRGTRVEHLTHPSQLFGISCGAGWLQSDKDFAIEGVRISPGGDSLTVTGRGTVVPILFTLSVRSQSPEDVALVKLSFRNSGSVRVSCRVRSPWIQGLETKGRNAAMQAALPQEAGGVVTTAQSAANLGMHVNEKIGLPTSMNTMEVFSLYDPDGHGGVFFGDAEADLDIGVAPIQFTFSGDTVAGSSLLDLNPGESWSLPAFAIGVHQTGDWHHAVDDYCRRHRPHWNFPDTPAWFRDQGAIYSFSGSGGGAIYMMYPQQDLKARIGSFEKLPSLLDEALHLGTNIVYLWDYWQGADRGGRPQYWNKGDYIPRSDMGGPEEFREGIRRIHEQGGRIILYVEPFIAFWYSRIGQEKGEQWAGRDSSGSLYHQYPQNYSMVACSKPWQDYITGVATGLVRDFGVDGIFLDSWGWQLNWPMQTAEEEILYSPLQYSLGVLALAKRVRTAIRAVKPDAIVIGESTSGALSRYWDGGLSADFAWLGAQNQHRIIGSPVRYGMPEANFFTNGRDLKELNQVFAAGYSLALLNANLADAEYIRKLVQIRQKYKDALIHGRQVCQPRTLSDSVPAYYYRGSTHQIITTVNTTSQTYSGSIEVVATQSKSPQWRNLLTDEVLKASDGRLHVELPAHSLLLLALMNPARDER